MGSAGDGTGRPSRIPGGIPNRMSNINGRPSEFRRTTKGFDEYSTSDQYRNTRGLSGRPTSFEQHRNSRDEKEFARCSIDSSSTGESTEEGPCIGFVKLNG